MCGAGEGLRRVYRSHVGVALMYDNEHQPRPTGEKALGAGEYSWGPGLVPSGLEDAPPSRGGIYRGTTPPVANPLGQLADELADRQGGRR